MVLYVRKIPIIVVGPQAKDKKTKNFTPLIDMHVHIRILYTLICTFPPTCWYLCYDGQSGGNTWPTFLKGCVQLNFIII